MTAAQRQKLAHERHRDFLANVTGLRFDQPFLDPVKGLVFQVIQWADVGDGGYGFLLVESHVNDPKDMDA